MDDRSIDTFEFWGRVGSGCGRMREDFHYGCRLCAYATECPGKQPPVSVEAAVTVSITVSCGKILLRQRGEGIRERCLCLHFLFTLLM